MWLGYGGKMKHLIGNYESMSAVFRIVMLKAFASSAALLKAVRPLLSPHRR